MKVDIENEIKPSGPKGTYCPFWRKDCSRVCKTCMHWLRVDGTSEDGETVSIGYTCAINVIADGASRTAHEVRGVCASTDKVANNVDEMHGNLAEDNMRLIQGLKPAFQAMVSLSPETETQGQIVQQVVKQITNGNGADGESQRRD